MRRFWEIKDFRLRRLPICTTTLQEVGILPTLVYFHPKGLILGRMWYRGPKALFGLFRNCLKPFLWLIRDLVFEVSMSCSKLGLRVILARILALRECLNSAKTALNAVLWLDCVNCFVNYV